MSAKDFFFKKIEQYKNEVALVSEDGNQITYREFVRRADDFARQIGRRCLIFLACKNVAESVIAYAGCLRNDIVPIMIGADTDMELLNHLFTSYHPAYIWYPGNGTEFMGAEVYQDGRYSLYRTDYEEDYELSEDLALLLTTSGSTGSPKLVRQTWRNIESNTQSIIHYLGIVPSDKAITTLPMHYTYGLSIINTHLCIGARMILTEATLLDKTFWNLLKEEKATTFGGVPYTYEILKKLRFKRMHLPSLRYITQAGGKLSKELAEEFNAICEEKSIQLIVMYGQTEATARMSYLPWKDAKRKAGSIGIAIPGGHFVLIDENGNEIEAPNEVGEMVYFGENVTSGYAESRKDLIKPDENCGVLHTGDMAKRDDEGFYYVVGRKKRFLKLFGNRVNLDEVEELLRQQKIENLCSGTDDHLIIFITDRNQEKKAVDFIMNHTGITRGGFEVRHIESIPRSESGKILYSALKAD